MTEHNAASSPRYVEVQRFTQTWIRLLVMGTALLAWSIAFVQLLLDRPVGNNPANDVVVVLAWLIIGVAMPAFFASMKLRIEVREHAICVRFFPFHSHFRCFPYAELRSLYARRYRPILEYGGWGVRLGTSGWAYNTSGNLGVQLVLRSGKRVLIGSQDPDAIVAAVAATGWTFDAEPVRDR
ncbi:MAG TPA: DUF6141 family protein [Longimicrobiales bacterium]|nr:DUF6141 family protein [Longimicrobiales bacterium]